MSRRLMHALECERLECDAMHEALRTAALMGEHGFRLVGTRDLSSQGLRGISMEFVDERSRQARIDVFVQRSSPALPPKGLMMYVEARRRGARPNTFGERLGDGRLVKGNNQCWSVEPLKGGVTFNLRACVARPLLQAYARMGKK